MSPSPPRLATVRRSTGGPRLVLIHGFTQTGGCWAPVWERLADRWTVDTVDLPGHGGSTDVDADLAECARLLGEVAADGGGPVAWWVGYSLGARALLRAAIDGLLGAPVVLLGATAGIDDPDERAARRAADEARAARLEADGVDAFLETWVTQPLFGPRRPSPADLAARRTNAAAGLARSLRRCGTGTMDPPWWGELDRVSVPALVAWGEHDAKFAELGRRLAAGIGGPVGTVEIAGAHHAAHLDAPDAFVEAVVRVASTGDPSGA
ncbi:MAG: alpha/beta fold hydrolase [Acidimicrobiales bacterium]|nr:alpha/beta fold hydrolase [Acidimicrobiales bacterium]